MPIKIFSGLVAIALMLAFLIPPVVKLKEVALGVVVLIGFGMMLMDLWQSLQSTDD